MSKALLCGLVGFVLVAGVLALPFASSGQEQAELSVAKIRADFYENGRTRPPR